MPAADSSRLRDAKNATTNREKSMFRPGANDVLRRFNRDTGWLAVWLLSVLVLAAFVLAFLIPEPHPARDGLEGRLSQAKSIPSRTEDVALSQIVDSNSKSSASEVTLGTLTYLDQGATESSSKESVARTEAAAGSTPASILVLPEPSPGFATAKMSNHSPAQTKEPAQVIRGKTSYRRSKSSYALRDVDVKKRLIELWHESLSRTEKPQSWSVFSKLDRRKKAALMARKQP